MVQPALLEKYLSTRKLSRKGAKAQSATAFLRVFFAPLRLCGFGKLAYYLNQQLAEECFEAFFAFKVDLSQSRRPKRLYRVLDN